MDFNIQDRERFLYRLIDDANVLVLYLDINGNVSICNKKIEVVTGKLKEDVIGRHWINVLYRDDSTVMKQQMFKAVMDASIEYMGTNNFEGAIADVNNNERFISWNITPILSGSKVLEGILLIGNDITELKEKEALLQKRDETLRDIFSSIKEYALYVTNLDGNITYYDMGSEKMFGWQKNEVILKHVSILHKDDDIKSKLYFILEQVRQSGKYEAELDLVKKDGQIFPVMLTVSKFLDAESNPVGYIFIAKDITERKKLEYQIFQAEKLAAIGQLAAGMAHEINNPLFVISGRLEIILEQKRLTEKLKDDLSIVIAQTERIRKLVDRFLKFARQSQLKLEGLNINDIIESVLPFLSYQKLPTSNVDLEKDFARDLSPIKGDLNQLQEVFVNLFINAYQAMPDGGKLSIKTSNLSNRYVEVRVGDTGCGIPQENLKNIFMPFFSTKKDGTGLGLSICYNIIKNHGGSIDIETKVKKGTDFIIKLPFA